MHYRYISPLDERKSEQEISTAIYAAACERE